MPDRIPWTQRRFDFSFPSGIYPELLERLRGAPVRARALAAEAEPGQLTRRVGETWSIQENIAHLADTDRALFITRLDQYDRGVDVLVAADMSNRATWDADHNARSSEEVLDDFAAVRGGIIERLEAKPPDYFGRAARHPRLDQPMRVVDLLYFKAEHDDYHFARARALLRGEG
jgi:uncharacterized damage-inducible protein DinB